MPVYSSLEFPTHWESDGNKEIYLILPKLVKTLGFIL